MVIINLTISCDLLLMCHSKSEETGSAEQFVSRGEAKGAQKSAQREKSEKRSETFFN